jgi:outer membrane protein OmpA-like peptidoglycan-associated protein
MAGPALAECAGDPVVPPPLMISTDECDNRVAAMRKVYEERTVGERAESAEQRRKDAKELEAARAAYTDAAERLVELTRLELKRAVLFGFGEDDVGSMNCSGIQGIVDILLQHPTCRVRVEGHTDDRPIGPRLKNKFDTNWELSAGRASTLAQYIIDAMLVDPARVQVVAYGKFRPVMDNATEEGRARNRRVEVVIFKEPPPTSPSHKRNPVAQEQVLQNACDDTRSRSAFVGDSLNKETGPGLISQHFPARGRHALSSHDTPRVTGKMDTPPVLQ